jgi:hypothetical protein
MEKRPPSVKAPGLKWRARGGEWIPYWIANAAASKAGYPVKTVRLSGIPLDEIAGRCARLTAEMREWMGIRSDQVAATYDGSLHSVIVAYQVNEASPYHDIKPRTKRQYDQFLRLVDRAVGAKRLKDLSGDDFRRWYAAFKAPSKADPKQRETVRSAQAAMTMIRIVINYGATLSDRACALECARLSLVLKLIEFKGSRPRRKRLTYDHAVAVIATAHQRGDMESRGIAFGQALQFELMLRQTDVIGTWQPARGNEPASAIIRRGEVWAPGLDWSMIDGDWILRLATSKTDTDAEFDLKAYPLVWTEITRIPPEERVGPLVKRSPGTPFGEDRYRKLWRMIATQAGVPADVWNMDSRAGAVTEAIDAGAGIEHVRHHATHSNVSMTSRYDRATVTKTRAVARIRAASRGDRNEP